PSAIVVRAPPSLFWDPTAPAAIYPLSLHDALPICRPLARGVGGGAEFARAAEVAAADAADEFERGRRDGAMLVGLLARHGGGLLALADVGTGVLRLRQPVVQGFGGRRGQPRSLRRQGGEVQPRQAGDVPERRLRDLEPDPREQAPRLELVEPGAGLVHVEDRAVAEPEARLRTRQHAADGSMLLLEDA